MRRATQEVFGMSGRYGGLIMETATLGPNPTPAIGIGGIQWIGARFSLSSSVEIDHIGVNLAGSRTVFGAIVPISGPGGLPTFPGDQLESFALAHTTFTAPANPTDLSLPVSVTLPAGSYGVVFGIGPFGSGGGANLTTGNQPTSQSSFFSWESLDSPRWFDQPTFTGLRIFVLGCQSNPTASPA